MCLLPYILHPPTVCIARVLPPSIPAFPPPRPFHPLPDLHKDPHPAPSHHTTEREGEIRLRVLGMRRSWTASCLDHAQCLGRFSELPWTRTWPVLPCVRARRGALEIRAGTEGTNLPPGCAVPRRGGPRRVLRFRRGAGRATWSGTVHVHNLDAVKHRPMCGAGQLCVLLQLRGRGVRRDQRPFRHIWKSRELHGNVCTAHDARSPSLRHRIELG